MNGFNLSSLQKIGSIIAAIAVIYYIIDIALNNIQNEWLKFSIIMFGLLSILIISIVVSFNSKTEKK